MLTLERLQSLIKYEPATGRFYWIKGKGSRAVAGRELGPKKPYDYPRVTIDGKHYRMHRIAWFYCHGTWPTLFIDHINGNRYDNRIVNLREASHGLNSENRHRPQSNSKTGVLGVSKARKRWRARVASKGKVVHLSLHDTIEEAKVAYIEAKKKHHPQWKLEAQS